MMDPVGFMSRVLGLLTHGTWAPGTEGWMDGVYTLTSSLHPEDGLPKGT